MDINGKRYRIAENCVVGEESRMPSDLYRRVFALSKAYASIPAGLDQARAVGTPCADNRCPGSWDLGIPFIYNQPTSIGMRACSLCTSSDAHLSQLFSVIKLPTFLVIDSTCHESLTNINLTNPSVSPK